MIYALATMLALDTFLQEEDTLQYRSEITTLCVFFRAMSRRWPWCLAAMRMYQITTTQRGDKLPPETEKLFEDFGSDEWAKKESERVMSVYPVPDHSPNRFKKAQTMGDFVEMLDALNFGDSVVESVE